MKNYIYSEDFLDVTLAYVDNKKQNAHRIILIMSNKCSYFDRGFCKLKNTCTKKHPSQDCGGQCEDIISCPYRHRMECKNERSCLFVKSNSCENLHTETCKEELQMSEEETLRMIHEGYGARISDLEKQIYDLNRVKDESALRISNVERKKFLHKIECLKAKVSVLENGLNKNVNTNSESNVQTEADKTQNYILGEESRKELTVSFVTKYSNLNKIF